MSDYISREAAIKLLTKVGVEVPDSKRRTVAKCINEIELLSAADVEPVRNGRWDAVKRDKTTWTCSRCGKRAGAYIAGTSNYCPGCGCKMDLEEQL